MAAHKPLDPDAFKESVLRNKGYMKAIAKEFSVSVYKIQHMMDLYYKPSEVAQIRGSKIRKI